MMQQIASHLRAPTRRVALAAGLLVLLESSASAEIAMSGRFVAEATCAASVSIREPERNPGKVSTQAGRSYQLVARNASPGSHYLILVPDAEPQRRWVAFGCGRVTDGTSQSASRTGDAPQGRRQAQPAHSLARDFVLAASWQPAFCEIRSGVDECRNGASRIRGFTLHGLWPQPRGREYCGVSADDRELAEDRRWRELPALSLNGDTREQLSEVMPGVESGLDRYQWAKHGTCWGGEEDAFFAASMRLLGELNGSPVRDLFLASTGEALDASEIRDAFDESFGAGAGDRVLVDCAGDRGGERMIQELRIAVEGDLEADTPLEEMILGAPQQPRGCRRGLVDPPGFD